MRNLIAAVERIDPLTISGRVAAVNGLLVEARGGLTRLAIGARVEIDRLANKPLAAEVVGFRDTRALLMPFGPVEGVAPGADIRIMPQGAAVRPTLAWKGRVIDAFGQPIDGKGPLPQGPAAYPLRAPPPPAHARGRVGERLDLGVRAMDVFTTTCRGQRLGIFAGSGVGKSVLLSMLAKGADCDAVVVGLIGERGREVREFLEETLGEEGLKRAIVVVATSDEPALKRRQAAYMTLAIAEFLRDQDQEVLCLMDSVTRFAMAQREIGLAAGEPPTTKGYTPTVFTELPKLLERAGPGPVRPDGTTAGPITGLFTILVDGDDHNEPIADAVRGILDGHIVMERAIAERGRFPAINVLKSISRTMPACQRPFEREITAKARTSLSAYANMEELIRIGAYRLGSDPQIDRAIELNPTLESFLSQDKDDFTSLDDAFLRLDQIVGDTPMKWAKSLIRISNHECETLQKRLAEIVERRWSVEIQIAAIEAELVAEMAHKAAYEETGFYLAGYRQGARIRREALELKLADIDAEEAGARDALAEAFESLKKYEHVLEAANVAAAKEEGRRETAALDELGLRKATR